MGLRIRLGRVCVLYILHIWLFTSNSFAQNSDELEKKYNQARNEFEKFEQVHGNFLRTRNTNMHYLTWGNPKNTPLIWIHGSFTNAYEIKDLAEKIVQEGFYLIAIDYYGHGLTAIPSQDVSLYHIADDIFELMNHKNIDKAIIGGWSRGGYIAAAFYDSYPEKVKGLILEDGGSVGANSYYHTLKDQDLTETIKNLYSDRVQYKKFKTEFEVYKEYHDHNDNGIQFELLAWITNDEDGMWTIAPGVEELFHMASPDQFLEIIKNTTQIPLFARSMAIIEPLIIFRNLKVPMLILDPASENDLFPFEKENERLKNLHPNLITHKIYEKTGHNIHYERPEKFLEDVMIFLKSLK